MSTCSPNLPRVDRGDRFEVALAVVALTARAAVDEKSLVGVRQEAEFPYTALFYQLLIALPYFCR